MCSATWFQDGPGYQLFFNRDEKHTRKIALPPRLRSVNGVKFIAPLDSDHGGTWIAVNEFGLSFCLLNRYDEFAAQPAISRGLLVLELIDCASTAEVQGKIAALNLSQFRPFTLAVLSLGESAIVFQWTSSRLLFDLHGEEQLPLTSSSFETEIVTAVRKHQFTELRETAEKIDRKLLWDFHRSHQPERSPYSVCMHREDAQTVSFSWLNVTPERIEFHYYPHAPCILSEPYAIHLQRNAK